MDEILDERWMKFWMKIVDGKFWMNFRMNFRMKTVDVKHWMKFINENIRHKHDIDENMTQCN